jgi:hypothetical protein
MRQSRTGELWSPGYQSNDLIVEVRRYAFSPRDSCALFIPPLPLCAFDQFVALTVNYHAHRRFLCRAPLINLYSSLTKEYGDRGIV